jgi:hypothetical protein
MTGPDERGVVETVPLAMLTLVVGTLVLSHAWAVITARDEAGAAARSAVRAYVEAGEDDPRRAAVDAARAVIDGDRRDGSAWDIALSGSGGRCRPITVRVTTSVPLLNLPWVGATGAIRVTSAHRELVDPFRGGRPGVAECDA